MKSKSSFIPPGHSIFCTKTEMFLKKHLSIRTYQLKTENTFVPHLVVNAIHDDE